MGRAGDASQPVRSLGLRRVPLAYTRYFQCGRYEEAANAAYKAVQSNPGHSISYMLLAAPLAKLGRLEEAKAAATRVLELQPGFRYCRQFSGVDCAPALAAALGEALRTAGLPE